MRRSRVMGGLIGKRNENIIISSFGDAIVLECLNILREKETIFSQVNYNDLFILLLTYVHTVKLVVSFLEIHYED